MVCKNCNSTRIVKYGHYGENQHWLCRACGKKFTDNGALTHGKLPSEAVSSALSMYYGGMSINAIRRHLKQENGVYPSSATVFEWINKYSQSGIEAAKDHIPKIGDTWVADETVLKLDGKKVWMWDIIDEDTRYLLATHLSVNRGAREAKALMELASNRAGKNPKTVITDGLPSYIDSIEQTYGSDSKHKRGSPFNIECNSNLIERFHGTFKSRTKTMRGLQSLASARRYTDGFIFFYNYLRPHEYLDGETPARKANLTYPFTNWNDVIGRKPAPVIRVEIAREQRPIVRVSSPRITKRTPRVTERKAYPHSGGIFTNKKGTMFSRRHFRGSRRIDLGAGIVRSRRGRHIGL